MKKFYLLTKTLLVATLLFVGASNVWAENVAGTLVHTASSFCGSSNTSFTSTVDVEKEHINNSNFNSNWAGAAYADFSFVIPSGHSVTKAELTFTVYGSGKVRTADLSYVAAGTQLDYATMSGGTAKVNLSSTNIATGLNFPINSDQEYTVDVTSAVQAIIAAEQTNIIFKLTNNAGGGDLYGKGSAAAKQPKLVITTSAETLYTVSFTEDNSLNPTVTIYSDAERETPVINGTLADKTTYYYRAVLEGYNNYEGSFTVDGANPSVSFTMTAKTPVASLTVNYKYGDDIVYTDNQSVTGLYVGESLNVPFRMYVMNGEALYQAAARATDPWYGEPTTLTENTVVEKTVTPVDFGGGKVVLFEDLDNTNAQNAGVRASYCSAYDNRAYTSAEVLPAGTYTFYLKLQNQGRGSKLMIGETEIVAAGTYSKGSWSNVTLTDVNVPSAGNLTIAAGGSSTRDDYDVIIAVLKSVPATIGSTGWTTFASPYALNLSSMTASAGDVAAYYASATSAESVTVLPTESSAVKAGEGILLKGTAGATITIPVVATGSEISGNLMVGCPTATSITKETANYDKCYVLGIEEEKAVFQNVKSYIDGVNNVNIPAGKAYLNATASNGARALRLSFGGITEVENVEAAPVATAKKNGAYLENGRIAIYKNGMKFNANGQLIK